MAYHGTVARFYYHDLDMSGFVESVDPTFERALADVKPLSASAVARVAGGRLVSVSLAGLYDAAPPPGLQDRIEDKVWARFAATADTPVVFSYLPAGDAFGYFAYSGLSLLGSFHAVAGDDVLRLPVAVVGTDDADRGYILHPLAQETATGQGTHHDNTAQTLNGGAAYIHLLSLAGTSIDIDIEHADSTGGPWTTILNLNAMTAPGSQMGRIAAGTTVKRWTRAKWVLTGTNATFFVLFARR